MFSIETLMENIKPVVREKIQLEEREKPSILTLF